MKNRRQLILLAVVGAALTLVTLTGYAQPAPAPALKPAPVPAPKPNTEEWLFVLTTRGIEDDTFKAFAARFRELSNQQAPILIGKARDELGWKGEDVLDNFAKGAAKIGNISGNYIGGQEPVLATLGLPLLYTKDQFKPLTEASRPFYEKVFNKYGLKMLLIGDKPNVMWSKILLNTPDDIRKMKFRSSSKTVNDALAPLGAKTITLTVGDISTAMSTGMINSFTVGPTTGISYKFYDVADYMYRSPVVNGNSFFMVIRQDAFNAWSPQVQKAFTDTVKEFEWTFWNNEFGTKASEDILKTKMTIIDHLSPQLLSYIQEKGAKSAWASWATKSADVTAQMDAIFKVLGISYKLNPTQGK